MGELKMSPIGLILAQEGMETTQWIGGNFALNILFAIAAAIIAKNKGHSSYQIAMHALVGTLCCGIGALISALILKDLGRTQSDLRQWDQKMANEQQQKAIYAEMKRMREEVQALRSQVSAERETTAPAVPSTNSGGVGSEVESEEEGATESLPTSTDWLDELAMAKPESDQVADEIRVACVRCGGRFSGRQKLLQSRSACPKCGNTPFDFRQLPPK